VRRRLIWIVLCVGVVAAAALYAGPHLLGRNLLPSALNPPGGLVTAKHAECSQSGKDLANYLATGSPTTLGPQWASTRSQILSHTKDAQPGLIRAQADAEITGCDHRLDQRATPQATAQARQPSPSNSGADALRLTASQASCQRVGGTWTSGQCKIDYRSPSDGVVRHYTVTFDVRGNVIPPPMGPKTAAECALHSQSSFVGPPGHWNLETDICSI
jgi:hypothetical protein